MVAVVAIEEAADRQVKQAADLQPTSLKANFMLEDFGGFSFQQGGASYSTVEFLPFDGGDHYKEVAHIRGVNLLSAAHTSARLEYINNNTIVPSVHLPLSKPPSAFPRNQTRLDRHLGQLQPLTSPLISLQAERRPALDLLATDSNRAREFPARATVL